MKLNFTEPACSAEKRGSFFQRHAGTIRFLMRVSGVYMVLIFVSLEGLLASNTKGQSIETIEVTTQLKEGDKLSILFKNIEEQSGLLFAFPNAVDQYDISLAKESRTIKQTLDIVLKNSPFNYRQVERRVIIYEEDEVANHDGNSFSSNDFQDSFMLVTGIVKDVSANQPMAGVNVVVKGTTRGTTTDSNGKYSIDGIDKDILVFSFIGFKTFETEIGGRTEIDVTLQEDIEALNEVVINAGYWHVTPMANTGNISRISKDVIGKQPVTNPLQALQGRAAGIYIKQLSGLPGSNFDVQIRGRNSIINGNDPLYVIDGIPFNSASLSTNLTSGGIQGSRGVSPLNSLNNDDIESIEILKDADATAIYGSRGANGVVLISTKRGKPGKTLVDLNIYTGLSEVGHKVDLLNTEEYLEMRNEGIANDEREVEAWEYDANGSWDQSRYTDWQDVLIGGTAHTTNAQASISGGNADTQFFVSAGYQKQTTVFPGDFGYKKNSSHFSVNHIAPNKRLKAAFSLSYVNDNNNLLSTDLTRQALTLAPNAPKLYGEDGKLNWENGTWSNPLARVNNKYEANSRNLIGNAVLVYEILPKLEVKANFGLNDLSFKDQNIFPSTASNPANNPTPANSRIQLNNNTVRSWIAEPQVNYEIKIGKGVLSMLAGLTFQQQIGEQQTQIGVGFTSDALIENISAATVKGVERYDFKEYKYNGVYSRANYNWEEKYIINLTARKDGSSRFGPGNQFANFGAVGAAWIFSKEGFFENNLSFLSLGKIRSSYGTSGNDQIGDYEFLDNYISGTAYQGIVGLGAIRLFNPDFAWEVNKKFEAALEFGFVEDRILITGAYYRSRSSNQLVEYPLAMTTGFNSIRKNLPAVVQNSGFEFEFQSINFNRGSLKWTTSANISFPRNKLVSFPNLEASTYRNTYVIGESLNISKRYHYIGVDLQTGVFQFDDIDKDGSITTSDRLAIKEIGQKYFGGLNNSFSFRGLQVDVFIQFVKQTATHYFANIGSLPGAQSNLPDIALDRWKGANDTGTFQRFTTGYNVSAIYGMLNYWSSDASIVDASFVRLKNVSISYRLPERWTKSVGTRIYVQGQNLITFTDYIGLDPENLGNAVLPPLRTFTVGVQLSL